MSNLFQEIRARILEAATLAFPELSEDISTLQFNVEQPREKSHGHVATNIAMAGAKVFKAPPRTSAEAIAGKLEDQAFFERAEIAGPGFLNLWLNEEAWNWLLSDLDQRAKSNFQTLASEKEKVLVEFVSANPTGPLHVGHGRGAAVGDSLVRLLRKIGHTVDAEYYVNDAGLQIENLGKSVRARKNNEPIPEDGYQGEYVVNLANEIDSTLLEEVDKEVGFWAGEQVRKGIAKDLAEFGVEFDNWFSERTLHRQDSDSAESISAIEEGIEELKLKDSIYEKDGALWFASEARGDTKDRVVRRSNGIYTYFAADIAYHSLKLKRGYDKLIDIWGADHHGYIPRVRAAVETLGLPSEKLDVLLIQFVSLVRDGEPVQMSTRSGTYETLSDLIDAVGKDATRFFYLQRKPDTHLEFDLAVAEKQSSENPVYYVQYAHARAASILRQTNQEPSTAHSLEDWQEAEQELVVKLDEFESTMLHAGRELSPHQITFFVQDVAALFHKFYGACPIQKAPTDVQQRRLKITAWTQAILSNCLDTIGVSSPDTM